METHFKLHSSDREVFRCTHEDCGKQYRDKHLLDVHIQTVHEGKRYSCLHCGKTYSLNSTNNFLIHIKKHLGPIEERKYRCIIEGCAAEYISLGGLKEHTLSIHLNVRIQCDIDGCDATFANNGNWLYHFKTHHEGAEVADFYRDRRNKAAKQVRAAKRIRADEGYCCVSLTCDNKCAVDEGQIIPACEEHRETWLRLKAKCLRFSALRKPGSHREGWGADVGDPDAMEVFLSMVPVPFTVMNLARKIEQANKDRRDFYIDFEFATLPKRKGENKVQRIPVEIAVLRLDGEVIINTPIKHSQSIPRLLAGVSQTGNLERNFTWGVMLRAYGQTQETHGKTFDEIKQTLLETGMNRDSYVVEWSTNGVDIKLLGMIMGQDTPINSIKLVSYWRSILPGFLSMSLSYFHPFIRPDSNLHKRAHQAGADGLMLIDTVRAMIDLSHRDEVQFKNPSVDEFQTDEQILQTQEDLQRQCGDEDDNDLSADEIDLLNILDVEKEAMNAMTDEDKALIDRLRKSSDVLQSVDKTSTSTSIPSGKSRYDAIGEDRDGRELLQLMASVRQAV
jgi:hypothetical protein